MIELIDFILVLWHKEVNLKAYECAVLQNLKTNGCEKKIFHKKQTFFSTQAKIIDSWKFILKSIDMNLNRHTYGITVIIIRNGNGQPSSSPG